MSFLFTSKRIFNELENGKHEFIDGGILVNQRTGKILEVFKSPTEINTFLYNKTEVQIVDYENHMILPGLIDSHVHVNEPGRTDWEGFETCTRAAAAGGFSTIVDMPLNSIPPTTTLFNLKMKIDIARPKIYVNCAFWGGIIPDNDKNLSEMVRHGVVGFKCFMCPSGVDEFPHVNASQIETAMKRLKDSETVIAFHAEIETKCSHNESNEDAKKYETYLKSRPDQMELEAIKNVCELSKKHDVNCHIVHLSSAEAIPIIKQAKLDGVKITVETCHHYLSLDSENIPDAHTEFKCAPPIRSAANQKLLWQAVKDGVIDLIVSDHSPSTPGMKLLIYGKNRGDFMKAWGGISSVQFGLPLFWTNGQKYGIDIGDVVRLQCKMPAKLTGLDNVKGRIAVDYDADFCVFNPDEEFEVCEEIVEFKNKANPYMGRKLNGVVVSTIVMGNIVYQNGKIIDPPKGQILLRNGRNSRSARNTHISFAQ